MLITKAPKITRNIALLAHPLRGNTLPSTNEFEDITNIPISREAANPNATERSSSAPWPTVSTSSETMTMDSMQKFFTALTYNVTNQAPRLTIKSFDGSSPKQYRQFCQVFDILYIEHTDVSKLVALIEKTSGTAHRMINHLKIDAANYKVARDILERIYGSREGNGVEESIRAYELKTPLSNNAASLLEFVIEVQSIFYNTKVEQKESFNESYLFGLVYYALDIETKIEWKRVYKPMERKTNRMEFLIDFLIERVRMLN